MTKLGTAFVDVQPDFSAFDRLVTRKLAGSFKGVGDRAGRDFSDAFDRHTSGLLLPFSDAFDDVGQDVAAATSEVRKHTAAAKAASEAINDSAHAVTAFGRDGEASFGASRAAAEDAADAIRRQFATLTPTDRLDLKLAGAEADVQRLRSQLTELGGQDATVEVKVQIAKALAELDRAEARVRELSGQRAEIDVDVDRSLPGFFSQLTAGAQNLFTSLTGGGGGGLTGATTRISAGFVSFGSVVGPLAAVLGALAVAVGVSLVGALAALASSLAFAVAGIGALGAAVGAVLGPALALAIATGTRLAKVFEALKAQDTAADEVGRNAAAGSQAAAAAAAAQESAARSLTDANHQLGVATTAAYREMADAAEAASDAIRGIESAQLSLDQARLSTERARLELEQFRAEAGATGQAFGAVFDKFTDVAVDTSGLKKAITDANAAAGGKLDKSQELELRQKILDVRQARLREKEATDGVSDAVRTASRAQETHNRFVKDGINASESYRAALRAREAATLAVAAAEKQDTISGAQERAIQLTDRLTARELQLLEAIKRIRVELRGAFQPATDAVFGGMIRALGRIPQLVNPLRGAFTRLGQAAGDALDRFSGDLVRPDSITKLRAFTDAGARLAGPVTRGLSSLLDILTDIARAALPFLITGTRRVADQLAEWANATGNTKALNAQMKTLMGHLKVWLGVGAAIGDVFLAFLGTSAEQGKGLAEQIRALAKDTAVWLRSDEGQKRMRQFFEDVIPFAKQFVGFVVQLIGFTTRFGQVTARVVSRVVQAIGGANSAADALVFTLTTLAGLKFAKGLADGIQATIGGFRAARRAAVLLHASFIAGNAITRTAAKVQAGLTAVLNGSALAAARQKAALFASRVATAALTVASKAFAAAQFLVNVALRANPIGLVITALIALGAGLVTAYQKSETFRRIVNGAFTAVKNVAIDAIQLIIGAFDKLLGAYSSIASGLSHLPLIGNKFKGAADAIDHAREKLRGFAEQLDGVSKIKNLKIVVDAELSPAMRKLLRNIEDDSASKVRKTPPVPLHRAWGGMVPGFGFGDTVSALLTPGEHVTRARIVRHFGPTVFADINEGRLDPRVGYQPGDRPALRVTPVRGNRFATGGAVAAAAHARRPVNATFPIQVAGGGPPDPVDLGVKASRVIEDRFGGDVGQE